MYYIEIMTNENSRLITWVRIMGDTNMDRAMDWANSLLRGLFPAPLLRITDNHGNVIGAWQEEGYSAEDAARNAR